MNVSGVRIGRCATRVAVWLLGLLAAGVVSVTRDAQALPDLVPVASYGNPYVTSEDFYTTSCAVDEGCTTAGSRRLLRFGAYTQNIGSTDLHLGSPIGNPLFDFHPCHGHYHFHGYLGIRLLTTTGTVVTGRKQSFCLLDSIRHNSSAPAAPLYNCSNQGLQAGWGDIYTAGLDCQFIDITGVAAGDYVLEMHVNPEQILTEANYANNISTTPVTIPAGIGPPPNDVCSLATNIVIMGVGLTGNTTQASNDGSASCGTSSSSRDVWFRYVPASSGNATFQLCTSSFDTVMSIHSGCPGTQSNQLACNDDSTGPVCGSTSFSELSIAVTAGNTYMVRVAGFQGNHGSYRLVVNGPGPVNAAREWDQYE